jgi:hypothetical protein
MLEKLAKIANELDKLGLREEADEIDGILLQAHCVIRMNKIAQGEEVVGPEDLPQIEQQIGMAAEQQGKPGFLGKLKGMFGKLSPSNVRDYARATAMVLGLCLSGIPGAGCAVTDQKSRAFEYVDLVEVFHYTERGFPCYHVIDRQPDMDRTQAQIRAEHIMRGLDTGPVGELFISRELFK